MAVDGGASASVVDSAVIGVVAVAVEVAVFDDEAAEATEVGVVLGGGPRAAPTGGRGLGSISPRLMRGDRRRRANL